MLDSLKRLTKHSAVYGIGHVVTRMANVALIPFYTHKLAPEEYGIVADVFVFIAFLTPIYTYGIDAAFLRYFILSDDPKRRRRVFSTALWAVMLVGIVFTAIIVNRGDFFSQLVIKQSRLAALFELAGFILLFDAMAFLPFLYLRAEEKSLIFITVKFISVLINISLNVYFILYLNKGVEGIFLANLWASGVTVLLLSPILLKRVGLQFSIQDLKALLRFGLPFLPSVLAVVTLDTLDRLIITHMIGLEMNGLYSAAVKVGMFMQLLVTAFRFAWHPFFLTTSKQDNAPEIFSRILTYFLLIGGGICLAVSLFVNEIVQFDIPILGFTIFEEKYWPGIDVVPLVLLSYLVYGIYVNLIIGLYLKEKTKYFLLITATGMALNIGLNFALIPLMSIMGAALAKLVAYVAMTLLLYRFSQRFYPIDYEFGRILKLASVIAIIFYAGTHFGLQEEAVIKLFLLALMPVLLFILGFFEEKELQKLKAIFKLA